MIVSHRIELVPIIRLGPCCCYSFKGGGTREQE